MSYPSNAPGAYPYRAVAATNVPGGGGGGGGGCGSSSSGNSTPSSGAKSNETDYSTDGGYSSSASNGNAYVEFVPRTYQQHHDQHGLVQAVDNPYPSHSQQEYRATLPHPASLPNPAYERPQEIMYAASVQQQQQHSNNNNNMRHQSPGSMAPPVSQPIHPAPMQNQKTVPVVPALPQTSVANKEQQAQQQQYQRIARFVGPPPVALACTECRSRHLKCDAGVPTCNRCQTDGRDCSYIKSRRGWKGTRRKKAAAAAAAAAAREEEEENQETKTGIEVDNPQAKDDDAIPIEAPPPTRQLALNPGQCTSFSKSPLPLGATPAASVRSIAGPNSAAAAAAATTTAITTTTTTTASPLDTLRAYHKNSTKFPSSQELPGQAPPTANLLQLYYAYFHSAHPFVLPPAQLITNSASQIAVLLTVIRFLASFFAQNAPTETFRREAEVALFTNPPRNAFTVQALLLFAIGLHSDNDQEKSAKVKDAALELALELGMNFKEFSESSYDGTQAGKVQAECWRRTWWELYYLDGLLAGFHRKDSFKLWTMPCTVPLPCEEREYATGRIPEPKSLQEFDDRYFALETTVFSSFAYRVDAVRILGQVLAVGQGSDAEDPKADAADASLVNWGLHLPECKKELIGQDRRVDEMLFQAHMVVNAAIIYLHRPKSHLATTDYADDTSCTPPEHWSASTKPQVVHTAKAITAANTIAKLITLPAPLIKHTPFFTCVITLAAIVHLSACSWLLTGDEGFLAKERIRLGVGALKTLGEVWSVADCVLMQVKGAAREVFTLIPAGTQRSGIITEEEVFRFIDEERTLEIVGGEADYHGLPELDWNGEWCIV